MTHIASRGKEEVPYWLFLFNITSAKKKKGGGSLPICRDIHMCHHNKCFTAPIFNDNFTAPIFSEFYRPHIFWHDFTYFALHNLPPPFSDYSIYRPHFQTSQKLPPRPHPFFVNFDWHRPAFWRWAAHMYQNFRGSPPPPPPPPKYYHKWHPANSSLSLVSVISVLNCSIKVAWPQNPLTQTNRLLCTDFSFKTLITSLLFRCRAHQTFPVVYQLLM